MENNIKLEQYLGRLDKGLGPIPVSEKAEIITEIKSHILDAQAKDQTKRLEDILTAIGEPELVANRYLIERGLKPMKAPTHPIFKWLIIGFLGTFAIIVLFVTLLIWKFTPLVKVNNDKVTLLGGTIDVDSDSYNYFNRTMALGKDVKVEHQVFDVSKIKSVNITNGSGDIKVTATKESNAVLEVGRRGLKCDLAAKLDSKGNLSITTSDKKDCSFTYVNLSVPTKTELKVKTGSGDIIIDHISGNIVAQTGSGNMKLALGSKIKSSLNLMAGSGDISLSLPKTTTLDYSVLTGSGSVQSDFTKKKDGDVNIVIKTGSGDVELRAAK